MTSRPPSRAKPEMSETERQLRGLLAIKFQSYGAPADKMAKLDADIAALESIYNAPKKERRKWQEGDEPLEHHYQCNVITWWTKQHNYYHLPSRALFSIPNAQILMKQATNRNAVLHYLKAEGMRDGILDMMLAVVRAPYAGLFIESKRSKGIVSQDQQDYLDYFNAAGYKAVVARSDEIAIQFIKTYLTGESSEQT